MRLRFTADSRDAETHVNLSAMRLDGSCLLVVYDSPAPDRLGDDGSVLADVVPLPA